MKILLTGGSGRLGRELINLLSDLDVVAPTSSAMNITNEKQVRAVMNDVQPDVVVHAAAYTNVVGAEKERRACWDINVLGTRFIAQSCTYVNSKLIHISTDYVFDGKSGGYCEDDILGPVINYYSLTKLVAEESARLAKEYLIVRTSFRPRKFVYPVAYADVFTSQDYVDIIALDIAMAIRNAYRIEDNILHIATERKSVYDLARRRNHDIQKGSRLEAGVVLPNDVSLNIDRWLQLKEIFEVDC